MKHECFVTAVGKSKKIAKRVAASKLLNSVRQLQNDNTSTAVLDEEEDELPLVSVCMIIYIFCDEVC